MTTNETLAAELQLPDPVEIARNSADDITRMIEALDAADVILNEDIAAIVKQIEANHVKRLKAKERRRLARQLANELEADRDK
jgi:hypothetical protein